MKTFIKIYEDTKINKIVFDKYIDFLKEKLNINKKIKLEIKKSVGKQQIGHVSLTEIEVPIYKVVVLDGGLNYMLGIIAHEMTHIKQIIYKELTCKDDVILWKNKEIINNRGYINLGIKNFDKYKLLPWEKEAYYNQDLLPKEFKKSKYYIELKNVNDTIEYLINNDLLLY